LTANGRISTYNGVFDTFTGVVKPYHCDCGAKGENLNDVYT